MSNLNKIKKELETGYIKSPFEMTFKNKKSKNVGNVKPLKIVSNSKPLSKLVSNIQNEQNNQIKKRKIQVSKNMKSVLKSKDNTIDKNKSGLNSGNSSPNTTSYMWYIIYTILVLTIIGLSSYAIYLYYNKKQVQNTVGDKIYDKIDKSPKGVLLDKEGAPIKVEETGDITENKYLSLYGGNDFLKKMRKNMGQDIYNQFNGYGANSQYISYPNQFDTNRKYSRYGPSYYSDIEDGVTKIYYKNVMDSERAKLNAYIREQNEYIRDVNKRIKEINNPLLYNQKLDEDSKELREIREYERRLANDVHRRMYN